MANVISRIGKAIQVSRMRGLGSEANWVGWGTGAGVAAETDVDLFTPAAEPRVQGVSSSVTTTIANDTYQVVATLVATALKTITNVGQWDSSVAGSMYSKADFAGLQVDVGDGIQFTMKTVYS